MSEDVDILREGFRQTDLGWQERDDPMYMDTVTGIFNRKAYEVFLPRLIEESEYKNIPLTLFMLDVDDFKEYDDTHGHQAGDIKLKEIAQSLQSAIRRTDYVFRWGGDEFALAFRKLGGQEATEIVLPKILEALKKTGMEVSIGAAERQKGDDMSSLMERADKMMYVEKGRKNVK